MVALLQNGLAEVRADEARPAGDEEEGIFGEFYIIIRHMVFTIQTYFA